MGQSTISARDFQAAPLRRAPAASPRRRFLLIAVLLSVGVHLAATLLIMFLPRVMPREAAPQEPGTVELLMVEQKGARPTQPVPSSDTTSPPRPPEQAKSPKTEAP